MDYSDLVKFPVSGDQERIIAVADHFQSVCNGSSALAGQLLKIQRNSAELDWSGDAADAFREVLALIGPVIEKIANSHGDAADVVRGYAVGVGEAQELAGRAERQGGVALAHRDNERASRKEFERSYADQIGVANSYRFAIGALESQLRMGILDATGTMKLQELYRLRNNALSRAANAGDSANRAANAEARADAVARGAKDMADQAHELRDGIAGHTVRRLDELGRDCLMGSTDRFAGSISDVLRPIATNPELEAFLDHIELIGTIVFLSAILVALIPPLTVAGGALAVAGAAAGALAFLLNAILATGGGDRDIFDVLASIPGLRFLAGDSRNKVWELLDAFLAGLDAGKRVGGSIQ